MCICTYICFRRRYCARLLAVGLIAFERKHRALSSPREKKIGSIARARVTLRCNQFDVMLGGQWSDDMLKMDVGCSDGGGGLCVAQIFVCILYVFRVTDMGAGVR